MDKIEEINDIIKRADKILSEKNFNEALDLYTQAFEESVNLYESDNSDIQYAVSVAYSSYKAGYCFEYMEMYSDAVESFELSKKFYEGLLSSGELVNEDKNLYIRLKNEYVNTLINLGICLQKLGLYEGYGLKLFDMANTELESLIKLNPGRGDYSNIKKIILDFGKNVK